MDEKQLKALYDSMSSKLELGEYNIFKNQISTDDKFRRAFYDEASSELELGDFNIFESSFKKKDGTSLSQTSQPQSLSPLQDPQQQSQSPSEDPKPLSSLIKRRATLNSTIKNSQSPASAPGITPSFDVSTYQKEFSDIDNRIKSMGLDPEDLEKDFSDFESTQLNDDFIIKLSKQKQESPLQYKRSLAAAKWHDAARSSVSKIEDETKRLEQSKLLEDNIAKGSKLPENFNSAYSYGKNTLDLIYQTTTGPARDRAIENFKTDFIPVLSKTLLKDPSAMKMFEGKNVQKEFALMVDDLFNKQLADQTRQAESTFFGNEDAIAARQQRRVDYEQKGLGYLESGLQDYIDNSPELKQFQDFVAKSNPEITQLKNRIESLRASQPDIAPELETLNKELKTEQSKLDAMTTNIAPLNDQKKVIDKALADYNKDGGQVAYDNYVAEVDRYNIMLDEAGLPKIKEQETKVSNLVSRYNGVVKKANNPELVDAIDRYNTLINQSESMKGEAEKLKNIQGWSNYIDRQRKTMFSRNPAAAMNQAIQAAQDVNGKDISNTERFVSNLGKLGQSTVDLAKIIYGNLFKSPEEQIEDDFARIGRDDFQSSVLNYNPNSDDLFQKPYIYVQSDKIKSDVEKINSDKSLSEEQKNQKVKDLMLNGVISGDVYQATNPRAGEFNFTASSVLNTITSVLPDVLTSIGATVATSGGGTASMIRTLATTTFLQGYSQYYTDAQRQGLGNPGQYAMIHSMVDMATELLGTSDVKAVQKLLKGKNGITTAFVESLTQSDVNKIVKASNGVFGKLKTTLGGAAKRSLEEPGEEVLASVLGDVADNQMFGQKKEVGSEALETFATMYVGNLPMTIIGLPVAYRKAGIADKMVYYNTGVDSKNVIEALDDQFKNGEITQAEYDQRKNAVDQLRVAVSQTPLTYANGQPMRDEDRVEYAFNQYVINRGNDDASVLPDDQKAAIETTVSEAKANNSTIINGKSSNAVKPSAAPELSNIDSITLDKGAIVDNTTSEVERLKTTEATQDDGVTLNMDGTKYEGGGLIVPIGSMNTTQEELTPEMIAEFAEKNKNKLSSGQTFKFGLYKFPNSNQVSIDLNIVTDPKNRDIALEFGRKAGQESLFDLSDFSNVPTGADGQNPMSFSDEQIREIGKAFEEGRLPNVFKTNIERALDNVIPIATKALERFNIKFKVVDGSTGDQQANAARGNQGLFISEDGTIIIDKSKLANEIEAGLVVWHEASHPVMNVIRNTKKPLYNKVVSGLKKAARTNEDIFKALEWAESQPQYDNVETQNDEAIVETIGRINSGLIDISTLDTGLRQSIIDFVNDIAKFFGIDPILNDTDLAAFKRTVGQVADALKSGKDISEIVGEENVSQTQAPTPQSKAVSIAKGTESLKRFGLPEGRNTTRKIGEALEKRTRGKYGVIARDDRSPDAVRKIASWMVEEVKYFLNEFGDKSGKGWYGEKFQKGLDKMADVFPELATDQNARDLFTMLVAVTSDGTEVMENFKQASQAYDYYKKNNKMPETASSQRAASYIINFRNIQNLVDQFDGDVAKMKDYLLQVSSISELNKKRKTEGLEALSTSWPASFEVPIAASIFGPKLGMFYANLSGMENYPTLDRWWSRTFNRYRGTLIPQVTRGRNKKGEALGIDAYREVAGLENASEDEVIANIIQDHDSYENKGYKNGTVAEKKANTLYKKLFVELNDAPFGKTDRKFMYDAFVETKKRLKAGGVDVSIADIQAILWYFEKNLYKKLGVTKPILGVSYEEAAAKTAQKYKDAGNTFSYEINKEEQGETIEEIEEVEEEVQASVGNRGDIYNVSLPDNLINSVRTSLRKKAPDSSALDLLDQLQAAKKDDSLILDPEVDNFLSNGITLNDIGSLLINDEVFEDAGQVRNYFNNIGDLGVLSRVQPSVGNRSEEDLRAPGTGKERNRALSSKFGDLDPKTQAKITDDAVTYFQLPNKQTEKAVNDFMEGRDLIDLADYVLSNPKIPEASKVWMAAEIANRLNAEIAAAQDQNLKEALTDKQAAIYDEFAKKATSLGQAVQAFIAFKKDGNAVEFFLPKILKRLKQEGVDNVTDIQKADIASLLKEVNNAPEGIPKYKAITRMSHYLAGIVPLKPIDVLQSLWYAKILSGITTQSTNFFASLLNTMFELPAVGLRMALKTGNPMALAYGLKGFGSGVLKGAVDAADIIKSGVRSKDADKYFAESPLEYFTWSRFLGESGKSLDYIPPLNLSTWKYVGRLLAASDALFSTANQEAIANMFAYAQTSDSKPGVQTFKKVNEILGNTKQNINNAKAQAIAEGFKPGTIQNKRRVLEIISQRRGDEITSEAEAIGKRITLNYPPEGWTKPFYDAVVALQKALPPVKLVIPFARIVANLTENSLNYGPLGLAKAISGKRNPLNRGENNLTNDERIDLASKFAIGMGALVLLSSKVGEDDDDWFEITAGGSNDIQQRYELQKGGWRPYTITLKDGTKVSYKDWPIAGILAGIGHIRDANKYKFEDSTQLGLYATGYFINFYDKSLLSGLQDFFGMVPALDRGKYAPDTRVGDRVKKYAAQQIKSVAISNLSQQTGRLYSELVTGDPQRDAKTFMELIYRDIPVINDGIRPIIDVFGDPVKYNTTERLFPVMSDPKKDEIIKWLNENKLFVGVPKKRNIFDLETLTERPMTDDEYYEYKKIAGQKTKQWIDNMMILIESDNRKVSEESFDKAKKAARDLAYMEIMMK
jgi:hypothetical protein